MLREQLKGNRKLDPVEKRDVSRAVFDYFRWLGWLDPLRTILENLRSAHSLATAINIGALRFNDDEVLQRAIPKWAGDEIDTRVEWCRSLQVEPTLWIRARSGQGPETAKRLRRCRPAGEGSLSDALAYEGPLDLFLTPDFHTGSFEVQDLSSFAVGLACSPRAGETWWDACAGEGGKTLHLSDLMQNKGLIWASDRASWRLKRLQRRAARAGAFNYRSALWDGSQRLPTRTRFDGVLIDAPCSGTGTWQRNPQARWTTTPQDITELAAVQQQLLANAASAVKPGGKMIYSVCTLTRRETTAVAQHFLKNFPDFEPLPIRHPLRPAAPPASQISIWPQEFDSNGMFIAAFTRRNP